MPSFKNKLYFELTEHEFRALKVSFNSSGVSVDEAHQVDRQDQAATRALVKKLGASRAGLTYGICGIYPNKRLLREVSMKSSAGPIDANALEKIITSQFRINPSEYVIAALNSEDGKAVEFGKLCREIFVCGAPRDELHRLQGYFVEMGIYPVRMEIASVATIGGLLMWLRGGEEAARPLLVIELGADISNIFILASGRVDFSRPIPVGLSSMISGVRQELGLKDDNSARKLFLSDSFDFAAMGPRLVDRLLRETQALIDFYEVRTGQSLTRFTCTLLPRKLRWIGATFSQCLRMESVEIDPAKLLAASGMKLNAVNSAANPDSSWLGLYALLVGQQENES